jgi:flagellar assembly protein FliH
MNMSSNTEFDTVFTVPVMALEYRDLAGASIFDTTAKQVHGARSADGAVRPRAEVELSKEEFSERIKRERAEATLHAEQRLRQEYEQKLQAERASIAAAVGAFEIQRVEYFARVEAEVVQLALAIAAKILHREAQVDPMLVAALVRMAVERMREGSSVTIRVNPARVQRWKEYFAGQSNVARVEVAEDAGLSDLDCVLETELGTANFGLDTQLKEVEQGFFDLLALRPVAG